jgi:hypothetical protein
MADIHVKTVRCNSCGACCMDLPNDQIPRDGDGNCIYLAPDGDKFKCSLGVLRPWTCCSVDPGQVDRKHSDADKCCVRYEVKGKAG